MKNLFLSWLLILFSTSSIHAQNKIIKGKIIDEHLRTLPYVSILIDDTVEVGKTDLNGLFKIDVSISVKKIFFNTDGLDLTSIELADNCDEVEGIIMLSSHYDFMTPRKIERLRLRRFKKLTEVHEKALKEGIFKINSVCYKQIYTPLFKEKIKDNHKRWVLLNK